MNSTSTPSQPLVDVSNSPSLSKLNRTLSTLEVLSKEITQLIYSATMIPAKTFYYRLASISSTVFSCLPTEKQKGLPIYNFDSNYLRDYNVTPPCADKDIQKELKDLALYKDKVELYSITIKDQRVATWNALDIDSESYDLCNKELNLLNEELNYLYQETRGNTKIAEIVPYKLSDWDKQAFVIMQNYELSDLLKQSILLDPYSAVQKKIEERKKMLDAVLTRMKDYPEQYFSRKAIQNIVSSTSIANYSLQPIDLVVFLCMRFAKIVRTIGHRKSNKSENCYKISDEYDVQDLLYGLLEVHIGNVKQEEWTPSYLGKSSRIDFILPDHQIAIEVKKTSEKKGQKEISDELIIDISRYSQYQGVKTLVCFIYDADSVFHNPRIAERELAQLSQELQVIAVIVHKGEPIRASLM